MNKNNTSRFIVILGLFSMMLMFASCCKNEKPKKSKTLVALSTFVLYDIASHIAEDTIELVKIIPAGVDIHSYEPNPKVMAKIEKSDIVFLNGAGLEPWMSSFDFKAKTVAISKHIKLRTLVKDEHKEHEHHGGQCSHSTFDPHIWFDIANMKRITEIITYELISLEPQHREKYIENRRKYLQMLDSLDTLYKNKLQSCTLDTIITDHNAFSYLSDKYKFNVKTLSGLSPDAEVSPKDMIRVIKNVKEYNVPIVFFENFSSDKAMKSLANQANVKVDSLHPLGNITKDDVQKKSTYEMIMKENLNKISEALLCQ